MISNDARYEVEIKRLRKRLAELEAIVAKLPKWADGIEVANADLATVFKSHARGTLLLIVDEIREAAEAVKKGVGDE